MADPLEVTDGGQHGQNSLSNHAHIPSSPLTDLHIGRVLLLGVEAMIDQDEHLIFEGTDQRVKGGVINVGCGAAPANNQPQAVQNIAEFATHDPTMVRVPLLADLFLATPFSIRMQQLDTVGVSHTQRSRFRKKSVGPILMRLEQAKQAASFRQFGEQRSPIPIQPTIKSPIAYTFDGKQYSQRHDFAGIQVQLRVFGDVAHLVINSAEKFNDKIFGSHGLPPCCCSVTTSLEGPMTFVN